MIEEQLARWLAAGLLDPATADRIRRFEAARGDSPGRLRWPVLLALAAGGLMLSAGALLFVAAHWADLSPTGRVALLLGALALSHGGALWAAPRFRAMATTLHAVGTAVLGAAIFLVGQSFHLELQWPDGFLLWALGAWGGWLLLREWPQALFAALLTPAWLVAEWVVQAERIGRVVPAAPMAGLLLLALVYLHAPGGAGGRSARQALAVLGAIALLPLAVAFRLVHGDLGPLNANLTGETLRRASWGLAFGVPLLLAQVLRGKAAWLAALAAGWVLVGSLLGRHPGVWAFVWAGVGAAGVAASGVYERSRLRINLGLAGFGLTVLIFYFSSVLDRLGRATSLVIGGVLLLAVGWGLERLRRGLTARLESEPG